MAAQFDLSNAPPMEPPDWDLNNDPPIDWDDIAEWEGVAEQGGELVQGAAEEKVQAAAYGFDLNMEAQGDEDSQVSPSYGEAAPAPALAPAEGSNVRKKREKRYYSDDFKVAIYLELLANTDPPVLHRGVSKKVAKKFNVPLRVVQSVWRKGQDYGVEGVKNKMAIKCGRKRVEIDREAIEALLLSNRNSTIQDLANALGVKKSTLYRRLKEGYFRRNSNIIG